MFSKRDHVRKPFAHRPQVGQRKKSHQIGRALNQPTLLDLDVADLLLDNPKLVFHIDVDTGLGLLQYPQVDSHGCALVDDLSLARHHGYVKAHICVPDSNSFSLVNATETGFAEDIGFLPLVKTIRHFIGKAEKPGAVLNPEQRQREE